MRSHPLQKSRKAVADQVRSHTNASKNLPMKRTQSMMQCFHPVVFSDLGKHLPP